MRHSHGRHGLALALAGCLLPNLGSDVAHAAGCQDDKHRLRRWLVVALVLACLAGSLPLTAPATLSLGLALPATVAAQEALGGIEYQFDADLPQDQQETIRKAIELGKASYGAVPNCTVAAGNSLAPAGKPSDDTNASAVPGRIEIYTKTEGWATVSEGSRYVTILHEYWHLVQFHLAKTGDIEQDPAQVSKEGPEWLSEGAANYVAARTAAGAGVLSFDEEKAQHLEHARTLTVPLNELETVAQTGAGDPIAPYSLGFLAAEYLVANHGGDDGKLRAFLEAIGGGLAWADAFQQTFGVSAADFYTGFAEHRQATFPPNDGAGAPPPGEGSEPPASP